jgi:hypothetical protein
MPQIHSQSSKAVTAVLVLALASLALAACGGSSSTSPTTTATTSASATTPTTGGRPGAVRGRFAALRECLKKSGLTAPPPRAPGIGGLIGGSGGFKLPKGVSKAQYEAALKKCGGFPRGGFKGGAGGLKGRAGGFKGGAGGFKTAAGKGALAQFAACMSQNGVKIPAPNTSGRGPIFNTKGVDTTSAKFKAAELKCRAALLRAFHIHPGTGAGAPSTPKG